MFLVLNLMIQGVTHKPTIIKNDARKYTIVGSIDHGMEIPQSSMLELIVSVGNVEALMMETPEELHAHFHPMSTEMLVKASVGQAPIHHLSGNGANEEIGEQVLKYAPQDIAEVFVPFLYVRNCFQSGQKPAFESIVTFISLYQGRFGFIDVGRAIRRFDQVQQHWIAHQLQPEDLDHFSYDFEKFVGDVREFEFWQLELRNFREMYNGRVATCVGDYHIPFVKDVFDGKKMDAPNWTNHIDARREDKITPQDAGFLKKIYSNLEKALRE